MPDAKLPDNAKGWLVALVASLAGLIAGFLTIRVMRQILKW